MSDRRWSGWGASARGPEHVRTGIPNQDAWMIRRFRDGIAVAVSDGLGSCGHADVGARAACVAVGEAAGIHFQHAPADLTRMPVLVQHLWRLLLAGHDPADCSATCLFVAARDGAGTVLAQLGDGLIAACQDDGTVDLLMPDKSESFANIVPPQSNRDRPHRRVTYTARRFPCPVVPVVSTPPSRKSLSSKST